MKILICICAIFLVTSEALDPKVVFLRTLVRAGAGISQVDSGTSETCSTGKIRDCRNCEEARICLPNGLLIATLNCSSYNPSTPYCNPENGICTAQQPASCGGTGEPFPCPPEDGLYPDPDNCAEFHYCTAGLDTAISCPKNNVYDHELGTCKLRRWISDCVNFDCSKKEGQDIVYPKDDRIWATCAGGKAYIMGRCKDYERYDLNSNKCARVCRKVGNQPIDGACNRYVRCADIGAGKIEPYEFPCPPGQGFDEEKNVCSSAVSCPVPSADNDNEDEGSGGQSNDVTTENGNSVGNENDEN